MVLALTVVLLSGVFITSWTFRYMVLSAQHVVDERCTFMVTRASWSRFRWEAQNAIVTRRQPSEAIQDGDLFRWETPNGPIWTSTADDVGSLMAGTYFRPARWASIDATDLVPINPGDVVMDAGAHLGESTSQALRLGASLVIAVEPVPHNIEALRRNLASPIAEGRIVVIDKGVYDHEGVLSFENHRSWDGAFLDAHERHGGKVEQFPVTTIDAIVAQLKLTRLDFIKMDIEGSETYALKGATETLRRFKPRLAIGTYHRPTDLEAIPSIVLQANSEYREVPSRCFVRDGKVYPNLLYYH